MCSSCDWESLSDRIEGLLDDERYEFASDTLTGIQGWIEAHLHCTERQGETVDNIEASVLKRSER